MVKADEICDLPSSRKLAGLPCTGRRFAVVPFHCALPIQRSFYGNALRLSRKHHPAERARVFLHALGSRQFRCVLYAPSSFGLSWMPNLPPRAACPRDVFVLEMHAFSLRCTVLHQPAFDLSRSLWASFPHP